MPKDPVCLMDVEESTPLKKEYHERTYYFCAEYCLKKFTENPDAYLVRHRDLLDEQPH